MNTLQFEATEVHTWQEWAALLRDKEHPIICAVVGCENKATDRHHIDGNHSDSRPENLVPLCKLCHNLIHGITAQMTDLKLLVRQFYSIQDQRKALSNKITAYNNLGLDTPMSREAFSIFASPESQVKKMVAKQLQGIPFWETWLSHVKGIGPLLGASLIAEYEAPDKYRCIRSMRAYSGYDVRDGKAPRRKRGEKANWNARVRLALWKVGKQFVRTKGSLGRTLYERYRAYYEKRNGDAKGADAWARRRVAKKFLDSFWVVWRTLEGLPVSDPARSETVFPEDWVRNGVGEPTETLLVHIALAHSAPLLTPLSVPKR